MPTRGSDRNKCAFYHPSLRGLVTDILSYFYIACMRTSVNFQNMQLFTLLHLRGWVSGNRKSYLRLNTTISAP